ncbi:MAG: GNAT family N-acetyltransferase [Deltaproteobacteria bacterium]|nr:GNAT family N-acetyltransferase [Deltaproteobacteria bacterium]
MRIRKATVEDEKHILNLLKQFPVESEDAIRCGGKYSCIEEFIVDEKGRGKGIGGQLIKNAIEEARSRGCYELQVNRPSESGYPVYMSHGWKDLGKHLNLVFHKKH